MGAASSNRSRVAFLTSRLGVLGRYLVAGVAIARPGTSIFIVMSDLASKLRSSSALGALQALAPPQPRPIQKVETAETRRDRKRRAVREAFFAHVDDMPEAKLTPLQKRMQSGGL